MAGVAGLLLAAGEGRRMGRPKALVRGAEGEPWVRTRARTLLDAGCAPVLVVVGAAAEEVSALLPPDARPVFAEGWDEGMGASLRTGLAALADLADPPDAAVVVLVDTPGLGAAAVRRVVERGRHAGTAALVQATYDGRPGHPVLIGRDHWTGIAALAVGDRGARGYLSDPAVRSTVLRVECADLGDGRDVDTPT